jgi:hypothetical protein
LRQNLRKDQAGDAKGEEKVKAAQQLGTIGREDLKALGIPPYAVQLAADHPVESNVCHKKGNHHDIGHRPFARLNHKELDQHGIFPIKKINGIDIGTDKFQGRENDAK